MQHGTLFRVTFGPNILSELLKLIVNEGFDPIVYTDSFGLGYDFHLATLRTRSPELGEFLEVNADSIRHDPTMIDDPPTGVFAGFAMGTQRQMRALAEKTRGRVGRTICTYM